MNPSRSVSSQVLHALRHTGRGKSGEHEGRLAFRPRIAIALVAMVAAGRGEGDLAWCVLCGRHGGSMPSRPVRRVRVAVSSTRDQGCADAPGGGYSGN